MSQFRDELLAQLPQLRAFARSLSGGNTALADDLVQDTCVSALRSQHQFEAGTNLRAWLFTILRNRFRTLSKRQRRRAEDAVDDLERYGSSAVPQQGSLEMLAFRRAFASLRPEQREALVLAVVHGLAYDEIAAICGCRVGTVKSRVSRARAELKSLLVDESPSARDRPLDAPEREQPTLRA